MLDCTFSLGYDQFLVPLARRALPLIRYAVERGVNGDRLESLLSRAEREEERILPPAERIRAPAKARPPLIIYAFGEARVLRGDRIISDSEWGTTKAKELFFYLLSHPPRRREQISDITRRLSVVEGSVNPEAGQG
jgi:two-component SAPR family response regulator